MDTIWLAEAYPWWRKHGMEARSSTVVSALMARETERLTIGWGIISPFTRHPVQVAMDARVVQEAAGPGPLHPRLRDLEDLPQQRAACRRTKTLGPMRDAVEIVRGVLGGERVRVRRRRRGARTCPALQAEAHTPRGVPPVYVAATAPKMQRSPARSRDGCLTPSITTPAFVRYTRGNVERRHRHRLHRRRLDPRDRPRRGPRRRARDRRHVPREQGAEHPGLRRHAARPRRDRAGRDPPGRRGDGAGRPARGEGEGHRRAARQVQADRRHARPTASPRSRSTATPAAPTSCSSSGARTATSRSGSSASRCCRNSVADRHDARRSALTHRPVHACRGGGRGRRPARRPALRGRARAETASSRARCTCRARCSSGAPIRRPSGTIRSSPGKRLVPRLRAGLLVEPRRGVARRARRRRGRPRRRLRGAGSRRGCRSNERPARSTATGSSRRRAR